MKRRKRNSTPKLAGEQTQTDKLDGFWEPADIQPEPKPPKPKPPLSKNPIIAALQRGLRERGNVHLVAFTPQEMKRQKWTPEKMKSFIASCFGDEAVREVGAVVIAAFIRGDKTFHNTIKKATKEADHVFHRDREKVLFDKFARLVWSLPEPLPSNAELRKRFEEEKNNGKPLEDYQWRRLRKALNLPKDETKPWDKVKSQTRNC